MVYILLNIMYNMVHRKNYHLFTVELVAMTNRSQRNFKERVFRMLFAEPAHAWELFRALEGSLECSKNELPLFEVVTLQNVLSRHKLNDLALSALRN